MNANIMIQKQKIDALFNLISSAEDEELQSHWAKYLCVLISGYLENAMRIALTEYVSSRAHPNISQYINKNVQKLTNLNSQKIGDLLNSFNDEWKSNFLSMITDEEREAINTIVTNRHNIAHGRDVGLTISSVKTYYERVIHAVEIIYKDCINC